MAEASKTVTMSVSAEDLLKVVRDYENYPEFVEGCHKAKILKKSADKTRVEYKVEVLSKEVHYTLDHYDEGKNGIRWELIDSNLMKSNEGSWNIKDLGKGKIEVTYALSLDFKIPVPGFILGGLVKSSLPSMLNSFEKRAKACSA